ncbi:fumarylacetoacetate hydrolase family protein [Microbacterium sp. X-17]|uniref:2-keto-4-pentenoate hydratase n=1 Tax=Microbacterium sp. X-17 TaxID=3144404 RepID=UPI0031F52BA7
MSTSAESLADNPAVLSAADRLWDAAASGEPTAPVRDVLGASDIQRAYAVQNILRGRREDGGARVVGRKIGLTSDAVQKQLGVDQPDFGYLFDDMRHADGGTVPFADVLQPRVEAEVAFLLAADLDEGPLDLAAVRAAVAYASPAIEVCGSRVQDWNISLADTVADNASAGAFVIGAAQLSLDEVEPAAVSMAMSIDGETVSTGTGADCMGDPLEALAWLARTARDLGDPLRAGQVILSGALGAMRPVLPGSTVRAEFTTLGAVEISFS